MRSKRIVVADDSLTLRTYVRRILIESGFTDIAVVRDGDEAIESVEQQCPDLAILDINMPGMDGFGVLQQLKDMGPPYDAIPVILLTRDESHALKTLGAHVGAFLHKPVSPEVLTDTVQTILEGKSNSLGTYATT